MEIVRAWKEEIGGPDVLDVVNGIGETGGALVDEADYVQFTGSDRTGQGRHEAGGRHAHPGEPRARRQGPADRPAGRRHRARGQRDGDRRARQHRPDLHVDRARLRRGADLRRVRRQAHRAGAELRQGDDGRSYRARHRRDDHPRADRDRRRPRRGRAREGRPRAHRRQAQGRPGRLVRADGDRGRRPLDEGDDRRDLRARHPGDEGQRRRRGRAHGQRHPLRALRLGLRRDHRPRARRSRGGSRPAR